MEVTSAEIGGMPFDPWCALCPVVCALPRDVRFAPWCALCPTLL